MKYFYCRSLLLLCAVVSLAMAQPANDNCINAIDIPITPTVYSYGTYTSSMTNLQNATVQMGEVFKTELISAGNDQRSVWYKFSLPTHRYVRIQLKQDAANTPQIPEADAGFTVYKYNSCLPPLSAVDLAKLTPVNKFGSTDNPCLITGDYLIQVSSKAQIETSPGVFIPMQGNIFIEMTIGATTVTNDYDRPFSIASAEDMGTLNGYYWWNYHRREFDIGCQTIEDATENCPALASFADYTQSTWHTFTTDAHVDAVRITMGKKYNRDNQQHIFGYRLWQGNARTTAIGGMTPLMACANFVQTDTLVFADTRYICQLQPNTSYSVQFFYHKDSTFTTIFEAYELGEAPTEAPDPENIPASHRLGALSIPPGGSTYEDYDYLACNSWMRDYPCGVATVMPNSYSYGGSTYDLNTWYTFELTTTTNMTLTGNRQHGGSPNVYVRVYQGDVNAAGTCSNLTLYADYHYSRYFECMPPGKYSVQLLGVSDTNNIWDDNRSHMGRWVRLNMSMNAIPLTQKFDLSTTNSVNRINNLNPLPAGVAVASTIDTLDCYNTLLPAVDSCGAGSPRTKAIYRTMRVDQNGTITVTNGNWHPWWGNMYYRMYKGDAQAMAIAQGGSLDYPTKLAGLNNSTVLTPCENPWWTGYFRVCVEPGIYTLVTLAETNKSGWSDQPYVQFDPIPAPLFQTPATAENMGDINPGESRSGTTDYFQCADNSLTVGGRGSCGGETKQMYREFRLTGPSLVNMYIPANMRGNMRIFSGRISVDGAAGVTPVAGWDYCSRSFATSTCTPMAAGWYTVVIYGFGKTYASPAYTSGIGDDVNFPSSFYIQALTPPRNPKYNRPFKAYAGGTTDWGPNTGTAANPQTSRWYTFDAEYFNCFNDEPLSAHPIDACSPQGGGQAYNRVAYFTFTITQESYINIYGIHPTLRSVIFPFDVRTADSLKMDDSHPMHDKVQKCVTRDGQWWDNAYWDGAIELCRLQPGTYTLATFARDQHIDGGGGPYLQPVLYVDRVESSRFDFASNAYDFGAVPGDNLEHLGKVGDTNPLNASRAPSNDFFSCTTGAANSDPQEPWDNIWSPQGMHRKCFAGGNPIPGSTTSVRYPMAADQETYSATTGQPDTITITPARRTLWYTFVGSGAGRFYVNVYNRSPNQANHYNPGDGGPRLPGVSIYRSNLANGMKDWTQVKADGDVDSTYASGLTFQINNSTYGWWWCNQNQQSIYIDRSPCDVPARYYIVVDNDIYVNPTTQLEIGIRYDSIPAIPVRYDHYTEANQINGLNQETPPYTDVALTPGSTYAGDSASFACATKDATDRNSCGTKTLWYKFRTNTTGQVRLNYSYGLTGAFSTNFDTANVKLYYDPDPLSADTTADLVAVPLTQVNLSGTLWGQGCYQPGVYYLMLTGCSHNIETAFPRVWLLEHAGDYCSNALGITLNTPGATVSNALTIDCHTIGEGYGEDGSNMGCLFGPSGYKSSWFKVNLDIPVGQKVDLTFSLAEATSALPSQIRYRVLYGSCAAMTTGPCNPDGLTSFTINCMVRGDYYVQVVLPATATGANAYTPGTLTLSARYTVSPDQNCIPLDPDKPTANFLASNICGQQAVAFQNFSSQGAAIQYLWDFGDGNTSTVFNPTHTYADANSIPPLPKSYDVTLTVTNTAPDPDVVTTITRTITLQLQPSANFTLAQTTLCTNEPVTFSSLTVGDTIAGVTSFAWNTCAGAVPCGSTQPTYNAFNIPSFSYTQPGTKRISLIVDNQNGCAVTIEHDLVVLPNFDLYANPDTIMECGDSLRLWASVLPTSTSTVINMPDGGSNTAQNGFFYDNGGAAGAHNGWNRDYLLAPSGASNAWITFTSMNENAASNIYIYDGPNTGGILLYGGLSNNIPLNTPLRATSGQLYIAHRPAGSAAGWAAYFQSDATLAGYTYSWAPATGLNSSTIAKPKASPATTTIYTVTVTSPNGCQQVRSMLVQVDQITLAGPDTAIDCGRPVYLNHYSKPNNNDGSANIGQNSVLVRGHFYDDGGKYGTTWWDDRATLISPSGAATARITFTKMSIGNNHRIHIYAGTGTGAMVLYSGLAKDIPLNTPFTSKTGSIYILSQPNWDRWYEGWEANWESDGAVPGYTYSWNPAAGLNDATDSNPLANPSATTTYTLTVTSPTGCVSTHIKTVTVRPTAISKLADPTIPCGDVERLSTFLPPIPGDATANVNNQTSNAVRGYFYDDGGLHGSTWWDDKTLLLQPTGAYRTRVVFTKMNIGPNQDIIVYDGVNTAGVVLYSGRANALPLNTPFLSQTGKIFIYSRPNWDRYYEGWEGYWESDAPVIGYTYSWSPTAGLDDATIPSPIASPSANTVYTLTVTTPFGCNPQITYNVTLGPSALGTLGDTATYCGAPTRLSIFLPPRGGDATANVNNVTTNAVRGFVYDDGGPVGTTWWDDKTLLIQPAGATRARLKFTKMVIGVNHNITVYDGTSTGGIVLYSGKANAMPLDTFFMSSSGSFFIYSQPNWDRFFEGWEAEFDSDAPVPGYTYSWTPNTGLSAPTSPSTLANPDATTTYTVTVDPGSGCIAGTTYTVTRRPTAISKLPDPTTTCGVPVRLSTFLPSLPEDAVLNVNNTSSTALRGYLYDDGGRYGTTWWDDKTAHINAAASGAKRARLTFTYSNPGNNHRITVYDGFNTGGVVLYSGLAKDIPLNTAFVSTSGQFFIYSQPNWDRWYRGWEAYWESDGPLSGYTYSWSPTAGLDDPTSSSPLANPGSTTTYTLTINGPMGCDGQQTVTVTVNPTPDYKLADPTTTCGDPVLLSTFLKPVEGDATLNLNNLTSNAGRGFLYDDGGRYGTTWWDDKTAHINAAASGAKTARLYFTHMETGNAQVITVYDGWNTGGRVLYTGLAKNIPLNTAFVSTSGQFYLYSQPNWDRYFRGFEAYWESDAPIAGYSYSWSPATGLNDATSSSPLANPGSTTTYTLTINTPSGCDPQILHTVTVNGTALTVPTNPTISCGQSTTLTAFLPTMPGDATLAANNLSSTAARGFLYDDGGSNGTTWWDNKWGYINTTASGATMARIRFTKMSIGTNHDLYVYDGDGTNGIVLYAGKANAVPLNTWYTATSGKIYIWSVPNWDRWFEGWEAEWESNAPVPGYTYSWSPATGLDDATKANPVASPTTTTNYTLTVDMPFGCDPTIVVPVTVNPIGIDTTFGPGTPCLGTGVPVTTFVVPDANAATLNMGWFNSSAATQGWLYDEGGKYSYNWWDDRYSTIDPPGTDPVRLTFTLSQPGNAGQFFIYNGTSTSAPLLWSGLAKDIPLNTPIEASSGAIHIYWRANWDRYFRGFEAYWESGAPYTGYTYSWSPATGVADASKPSTILTPTASTTYTLTITAPNGCTRDVTFPITLAPTPTTSLPDAAVCDVVTGWPVTLTPSGGDAYRWLVPEDRLYVAPADSAAKCSYALGDPFATATAKATYSASSYWSGDPTHGPWHAVLNNTTTGIGSWASNSNTVGQYLQIDLGGTYVINRVATQGRPSWDQWVTSYTVWTSVDGTTWTQNGGTYTGNTDRNTVITRTLATEVSAHYVRIYPQAWNGHMSMRAEVYAKEKVCHPLTYTSLTDALPIGSYSGSGWWNNNDDANWHPFKGKINSTTGWHARNGACNQSQWAQVDLGTTQVITAVRTQGRGDNGYNQWVTSYKVAYSLDGVTFTTYKENGSDYVFPGNWDYNTIVVNKVSNPFLARYVRMMPWTWSNCGFSMRYDFMTSPQLTGTTLAVSDTGSYVVAGLLGGCAGYVLDTNRLTTADDMAYEYRSRQNGNWTDLASWEVNMGVGNVSLSLDDNGKLPTDPSGDGWVRADMFPCGIIPYPTSRSMHITVRHELTYDYTIPWGIDETEVTAAGIIYVPQASTLYMVDSSNVVNPADIDNYGRIDIEGNFVPVGVGLLVNSNDSWVAYISNGTQNMWDGTYGHLQIHCGRRLGVTTRAQKHISGTNTRVNTGEHFEAGWIVHGTYNLTLATTATITGADWLTGYHVTNSTGALVKEGQDGITFVYPVGHATTSYNPAWLANSGTTDDFAVRVTGNYDYDPMYSTDPYEWNSSVNRTWEITETVPGGSNVTMRLLWVTEHENPGFARSAAEKVHFTNTGGVGWYREDGPRPAMGMGSYSTGMWWFETGGITSFSPHSVSSIPVLPIEGLRFSGHLQGADGHLQWATDREINCMAYELLRQAPGDATFGQIGFHQGAGTTDSPTYYSQVDPKLEPGVYHYRLRQLDFDGSEHYSQVVTLSLKASDVVQLRLYPNPVSGKSTTLQLQLPTDMQVETRVYNAIGQEVHHSAPALQPMGVYSELLPTESWAVGTYYIKVRTGNQLHSLRLIVLE